MAQAEIALGVSPRPRRIAKSKTCREARRDGLAIHLFGTGIRVVGLDALPVEKAVAWRFRFKTEKEALYAELGGTEDAAGPILRRYGIEVVYAGSPAVAQRLIAEIVADSEKGPKAIGLDIETMPIPSEMARREDALRRLAQIKGRARGLKAIGRLDKAEAEAAEAKILASIAEHADKASLDPYRAEIRLVQIYAGGRRVVVIDMTRVPWDLLDPLWNRTLVIHNAAFELKFLALEGIEPAQIACTMQAAGLLLGSRRRKLSSAASEFLDLAISKKKQKSDWSAPNLSQPQINYAALDAVLALKLAQAMFPALGRARSAYDLQIAVLPAIVRMELRGIGFNRAAHEELLAQLRAEWARLEEAYAAACDAIGRPDLKGKIPTTPIAKQKLLRALLTSDELSGWPLTEKGEGLATDRADLRRALHYPPIAVVVEASVIDKQLTAFGPSLAIAASGQNRIHAHYNVAATNSGRASCSDPNLQQVPRDRRFRRLFEAAPGHVLVAGDWHAMELRAVAHTSGDFKLTQAFRTGEDPHALTATAMSGIRPQDVSPEEFAKLRTAAKAVNFGSIYGMGPSGLMRSAWENYGVVLSEAEARNRLDAFAATYPGLIQWRNAHADLCRQRGYIRIGRDFADDRGRAHKFIWNKPGKQAFSFTQSCNLPVQGACADAAMRALTIIERLLFEAGIEGGPVAWLHDEILLEVPEADAEEAATLLRQAMTEAFLETFPGAPTDGLVEPTIGRNWAEARGLS